jgi:tRNA threonylcarbamoyladenosine biosynthesis protein TsaE
MANGLTYTRITRNPEDTKQLAATLAPLLRAGDVIMLNGDLGAGKTQFVQGVARALGIADAVTSPTFTILVTYEGGALELNHFDLYRLDDAEQLEDIGYWDAVEGDGASFIEWGDKFPDEAPSDYLEMRFTVDGHGSRTIKVHAYGERARRLLTLWASNREARLEKAGTF